MPDELDCVAIEPSDQRFEIDVECADLAGLGVRGIPVPPEIERVDRSSICQRTREMIPPVGVRTASVQQDEGGRFALHSRIRAMPMQAMEFDAVFGFESM